MQNHARKVLGTRDRPNRGSRNHTTGELRFEPFWTSGSVGSAEFFAEVQLPIEYVTEISYSFAVGSKTYRGTRVSLAPDSEKLEPGRILRRYPKGRLVTVYYNPDNPNDCILEREDVREIRKAWLALAVLMVFIVAGLFVFTQEAIWLRQTLAKPARTPLVVALSVFSLFLIFFASTAAQQTPAVKNWAAALGWIARPEKARATKQWGRENFALSCTEGPAQSAPASSGWVLTAVLWLAAAAFAGAAFAVGWIIP